MYIAIGIAAALFAADRILKYLSRTGKLKWEGRYVRLTHLENRGFFLGLGQKHEKLLRWLPLGVWLAAAACLLPELGKQGKAPFDFIILDPPAFTKSRKTVAGAERGYKEINLRALKLLPRGCYFATASCSHFMPSERFVKMLKAAAADAGVELRQIEARQQAPDHPILWNVPETDYLKFYIFQVV